MADDLSKKGPQDRSFIRPILDFVWFNEVDAFGSGQKSGALRGCSREGIARKFFSL
jgi:hypothetical protein